MDPRRPVKVAMTWAVRVANIAAKLPIYWRIGHAPTPSTVNYAGVIIRHIYHFAAYRLDDDLVIGASYRHILHIG